MIPAEEWLEAAKRTPLGASRRLYHGNEARANLQISNHADRWSCWCFRCGEGGVVRKSHVILAPSRRAFSTNRATDLTTEAPKRAVVERLLRYGVTPWALSKIGVETLYSPSERRLYLRNQYTTDSRATLDGVEPKWIHSGPYTIGQNAGDVVLITEDVLSAYKIALLGIPKLTVMSVHGTNITKHVARRLMQYRMLLVMFDGDPPGEDGVAKARTKLCPFMRVVKVDTPAGKDPKDLPFQELQHLIMEKHHV